LLGEVPGGRTYEELLPHCFEVDEQGVRFKCVGLQRLIAMKNAAGRPKDFEAIAELRAIQEEQEGESR
jgi:predicted nucleotidyltransferase